MSVSDRVSPKLRAEVIDRDEHLCRICGRWVDHPALHHIMYRSAGGLDVVENLVSVGWLPGHDCHLTYAHGADALLYRDLLRTCAVTPGVSAIQLLRWARQP